MFGIASAELSVAFILCILASVWCIIYGIIKWNDTGPLSEDLHELGDSAPED